MSYKLTPGVLGRRRREEVFPDLPDAVTIIKSKNAVLFDSTQEITSINDVSGNNYSPFAPATNLRPVKSSVGIDFTPNSRLEFADGATLEDMDIYPMLQGAENISFFFWINPKSLQDGLTSITSLGIRTDSVLIRAVKRNNVLEFGSRSVFGEAFTFMSHTPVIGDWLFCYFESSYKDKYQKLTINNSEPVINNVNFTNDEATITPLPRPLTAKIAMTLTIVNERHPDMLFDDFYLFAHKLSDITVKQVYEATKNKYL